MKLQKYGFPFALCGLLPALLTYAAPISVHNNQPYHMNLGGKMNYTIPQTTGHAEISTLARHGYFDVNPINSSHSTNYTTSGLRHAPAASHSTYNVSATRKADEWLTAVIYISFIYIFASGFLALGACFFIDLIYYKVKCRWAEIDAQGYSSSYRRFKKCFNGPIFALLACIIFGILPGLPLVVLGGIMCFCCLRVEPLGGSHGTEEEVPKRVYKRVTRTDVDNFTPDYYSICAQSYSATSSSKSYNKKVSYGILKTTDPDVCTEDFCVCCLDHYDDNSKLIVLPCEHYFHFQCFKRMRKVKRSDEHLNAIDSSISTRCPLCQLNLLRHFLFYKHHDLDPKDVKYYNKE